MFKKWRILFVVTILFCTVIVSSCSKEEVTVDYPPAVMFQNSIYSAASKQITGLVESDLFEVGEITSYTADFPTVNNQANDDLVGCPIYTSNDFPDYIFVLYVDSDGMEHYLAYINDSN